MAKNEYLDPDYQKKYRSQTEHIARNKQYKQTLHKKKVEMLKEHLGDCCSECGSKDRLELDHINPKVGHTGKANGHRGLNASLRHYRHQLSLDNLRWLCYNCHKIRSAKQLKAAWSLFTSLPIEEQETLISKL